MSEGEERAEEKAEAATSGEISLLPEHLQGKRGDGYFGDGAKRMGRANLRMIRRAIKEGWPVSIELKTKIVEQLQLIVEAGDDEETIIKAARALMEANAQNMKLMDLELKAIDLLIAREEKERQANSPNGANGTSVNVNVNVNSDPDSRRSRAIAILDSLSERAGIGGVDGDSRTVDAQPADGGFIGHADDADAAAS